jgi:hypothetical protein
MRTWWNVCSTIPSYVPTSHRRSGGGGIPSYISPNNFALALRGLAQKEPNLVSGALRRTEGPGQRGGKSRSRRSGEEWLIAAAGWLITILAVSLGAPFWFDALNTLQPEDGGEKARGETGLA